MTLFRWRHSPTRPVVPERPPHLDLVADRSLFRICTTCHDPYGTEAQQGFPTPQRCRCNRTDEPTWPRFDFNEHVHLCRCCRAVALDSGSRWSVWFCKPCKDRVRLLNHRLRRAAIPIGRHSLMAGVGIAGVDLVETKGHDLGDLIEGFAREATGLRASMDLLSQVARHRTIEMRRLFGYGPLDRPVLAEWLARAQEEAVANPELGVDAAFRNLVQGMGAVG